MYKEIDVNNRLMWFYCDSRLSAIMPKNINNISYVIPPYYLYTIDICNKVMNNKKFPNVTGKEIYKVLSGTVTPEIETKYPLYNWNHIWVNIHNKYIDKYDRFISYKLIYNMLPTKMRLKVMNVPGHIDDKC